VSKPRLAYSSAQTLLAPLRLETRKLSFFETGPDILGSVVPEARSEGKGWVSQIVIDGTMDVPFGPSRGQLLALIPCTLDDAVRTTGNALSLPVCISRLRPRQAVAGTLVVGLHELAKLYAAATQGEFEDAVLVSCFIRPGRVYAARVPRGAPLADVLAAIPEVKAHMEGCTDDAPTHPITGEALDLSLQCRLAHTLVWFPGGGYSLAPAASFLLPFPVFNRTLSMREGAVHRGTAGPCSNCLACVRYCPAGIHPSLIHHYLAAGKQEDAVPLGLSRCIECGWCGFVCPSRIPLCRQISAGVAALAAEETEEEEAGDA